MIIGTAGHVDHGKTTLVKALTGVDTDRLAEEKRRGITIDLGYAYTGELGFVDVPGHERFVHTMLAGASGIDTALLVVSLPEGIRPQTREHLQILSLLGIGRGVVALTKADLAADRIGEVTAALGDLLASTPLAGAPVVPVAALTGQGIAALRDALLASAGPPRGQAGHARLAVDRAFTLAGAGLIVTGTLVSGRIVVEDRLMLSPAGLELRVRGLHAQNRQADHAVAGQRVALNITGPRLSKDMVNRGDWVLHPDLHAPTDAIDARITLLSEARTLRQDTEVHFHLGAAHVMARISLLDVDKLEPGRQAFVRLALRQRIGALAQDRLVLRDTGARTAIAKGSIAVGTSARGTISLGTIGGGIVLDPAPPRRGRRAAARLMQLMALDTRDAANALRGLLSVAPYWTDATGFRRARNLPDVPLPADLPLLEAGGLLEVGGLFVLAETFGRMRDAVVAVLTDHHRTAPELPGLHPERLRLALAERPPIAGFRGILDRLVREGIIAQEGPWFRLPGHRISLSPADERIWAAIKPLLQAERFRPPRTRELATAVGVAESAMRATLKRLLRIGQVIEIAPDHFFPRAVVAEMAAVAVATADEDGLLTAAAFRDKLDNGRKVAIQILEFFDRAGLTVRVGDARQVRSDKIGLFGQADPAT